MPAFLLLCRVFLKEQWPDFTAHNQQIEAAAVTHPGRHPLLIGSYGEWQGGVGDWSWDCQSGAAPADASIPLDASRACGWVFFDGGPKPGGLDRHAAVTPPVPRAANGTTRSVTVRNADPDEILRQAILLRSSTGRKASLQVKRRQVSKNPSIQGVWTNVLQDRIKGVQASR